MLFVFLKNKSLAESFTEQQSILNLNEDLAVEIESLHTLTTNLASTLDETEQKKKEEAQEAKTLSYRLSLAAEEREQKKEFLTQTKNQEKIYQEELKELEAQQSEISSEIEKIEDELRRSFDVTLLPLERPGILLWPVPLATSGGQGRITQHFGERSNLYRGKPHNGLDIGAPIGTPVIAADDGIVIGVDNNDNSWRKYQYGKYVLIEHKTNLTTLYAHLSKQVVSKGDSVKRGDIIGYVGNTGYSTGPHLHFGVYWRDSIIMKSIPPAKGLVPVGVVIDAEKYL
ncbi:MAG: hypothetical protein COU08_03305 [Candidatus Harrisonbacteria bacterium CG10_big_fil_rev_8_21_14_0_10_42_17]|uniref:M23ase beta-sheet core domain-containing protein n=1 Tax=Candidatus Harrisonbacteria bacterium CG10_big_fil_rev_8_21_14_0_10_42_17 TaxID=1974584 RepID=A0A2M6WHQ6_9BACT|nr:MAG: hypothetical protein COU08_03305 [Candidatus Harrisonbacteria bacterium CG10_big_fil_rev_8_21_14_0_10_42_17]